MFGRSRSNNPASTNQKLAPLSQGELIEALEDRRLLWASGHPAHHSRVAHQAIAKHASLTHAKAAKIARTQARTAASTTATGNSTANSNSDFQNEAGESGRVSSIQFSQSPAKVQSGLRGLASADSLAAPTSSQTVYLGNSNGIETYTLNYTASGTTTKITVDQNGSAVTAPTTCCSVSSLNCLVSRIVSRMSWWCLRTVVRKSDSKRRTSTTGTSSR